MLKPIQITVLSDYRLKLRFNDGVEGQVDLSGFVGKGVFSLWEDQSAFEQVHVGEHGQIVWSEEVELCSDALYLQITGKEIAST